MELGEFRNLGSPEWQAREWSLSSQINRIPVRDFNQGRKGLGLHLVSIIVASPVLSTAPGTASICRMCEMKKWMNARMCSGRLLWQEWRRWPEWEEPRNSSLHPSSNMGSGPSSLTTPPSNMKSCWWINPPTSFCLLHAYLPSPSSSFLFLPTGQASIFLAQASQVCNKEPLQPTLLVRRYIKWISDSGPSQWFRAQKLNLGNFLAHFRLPFSTSLLSLTSSMERKKKKKSRPNLFGGKSKADAKKRIF